MKDIDGNIYKTVTINGLTWMAENLKVEKLNDGTAIQKITSNEMHCSALENNQAGYCYYNFNNSYKNFYGGLYNPQAVKTNKLCPQGWHVASTADFANLVSTIGDPPITDPIKYMAEVGWIDYNTDVTEPLIGTNDYGFSAVATGLYQVTDPIGFTGIGYYAQWYHYNGAIGCQLDQYEILKDYIVRKKNMISVRCVKD